MASFYDFTAETLDAYVQALRSADQHDIQPLVAFARS